MAAWSLHPTSMEGISAPMTLALVVGLFLGFVGSIPVAGPTSVIVLKNTLEKGNREGLDIAAGAGLAEAIYAFLAFWGLTAALLQFPEIIGVARIVGGVLITMIGIYLVARRTGAKERRQAAKLDRRGHRWVRGFASAIFNPTLIVTWTSVVTALHATSMLRMRPLDAVPFAIGVAAGIMGWFFLLIKLVQRFRDRMRAENLDRVIRAMGWAMIAIGALIMSRAIFKLHVS
jgi:threonine/homoserine/homoserine lactone efflux protein